MAQWLRTMTGSLCILTVLLHLIPKGKLTRYVRFYAGLLFFLMSAGPLWKLLAGEGGLERLLQLEFLREDYSDLESSVAGMEELKNDRIRTAYRSEIARQVREIAAAYGLRAEEIRLSFDSREEYRLTGISFAVPDAGEDASGRAGLQARDAGADAPDESVDAAKREIASVYMLDPWRINVRGQGE